jgi:hypothetical protein
MLLVLPAAVVGHLPAPNSIPVSLELMQEWLEVYKVTKEGCPGPKTVGQYQKLLHRGYISTRGINRNQLLTWLLQLSGKCEGDDPQVEGGGGRGPTVASRQEAAMVRERMAPLSGKDQHQVDTLWRVGNDEDVVVNGYNVKLLYKDIFFTCLLKTRDNGWVQEAATRGEERRPNYFFNSFFMIKLMGQNLDIIITRRSSGGLVNSWRRACLSTTRSSFRLMSLKRIAFSQSSACRTKKCASTTGGRGRASGMEEKKNPGKKRSHTYNQQAGVYNEKART